MNISKYKTKLAKFADERNWEQFHSPKNLSMALAGEVGELLEIFQWLTENESKRENLDSKTMKLIEEEIADICIYLIRLSDKLNIDLDKVVDKKIKLNDKKYPIKLAKGNATKYNRRNK